MLIILLSFIGCTLNSVYAYTTNPKFLTNHYAIFEITLGPDEEYGVPLKNIIAQEAISHSKYQSTSIIFPYQSPGLESTIKESALGVITTENYDKSKNAKVTIDDGAKYATYAGIYITFEQLKRIVDNRSTVGLIAELVQMPLIITDLKVDMVSKNFKGDLFYTSSNNAILLDFQAIDSLYYTSSKMASLKNGKCKVSVLAITDRSVAQIPYYIAAHGAVNDIKCSN